MGKDIDNASNTTLDLSQTSSLLFNGQWLLIEIRTTKERLVKPEKINSMVSHIDVQISNEIRQQSPSKIEIVNQLQIQGWLISTVSVFSPLKDAGMKKTNKKVQFELEQKSQDESSSEGELNSKRENREGESKMINYEVESCSLSKLLEQNLNKDQEKLKPLNENDMHQDSLKIKNNTHQKLNCGERSDQKLIALKSDQINEVDSNQFIFDLINSSNPPKNYNHEQICLPQISNNILGQQELNINKTSNNFHASNLKEQNLQILSSNNIVQSSSFSENLEIQDEINQESSEILSYDTDKTFLGRVPILRKSISKSSTNIDKCGQLIHLKEPLLRKWSNEQQNSRKSSYTNSIQFSSSPTLSCLNNFSSPKVLDSQKRDRKNLVKNYFKAFKNFLNCLEDEKEVISVLKAENQSHPVSENEIAYLLNERRRELEKLIGTSHNFNNSLMVSLIRNSLLRQLLQYFLKNKAGAWIESSKIKDKQSHYEALQDYIQSLDNPKALSKVRCLKYKSISTIEEEKDSPE